MRFEEGESTTDAGESAALPNAPVELNEFRRPSGVKYSICTLVNCLRQYRRMLETFERGGFHNPACEFLYVDNSSGNRLDAFEGISEFLCHARGELIVLCHQDVRLHDAGRDRLDGIVADLNVRDPKWALLGNAGGIGLGRIAMRITDAWGADRRSGRLPARVDSLDENFIVVRRSANLGLSCDVGGFHLYGADLCASARQMGRTAWVVDFHLHHGCGPKRQDLPDDFSASRRRWIAKQQRLCGGRWVQTPCTAMYVSGSPVRNRLFNALARLLGRPLQKWTASLNKRRQSQDVASRRNPFALHDRFAGVSGDPRPKDRLKRPLNTP